MSLMMQFVVVFFMGFFFGIGALVAAGYLLGERQRRVAAKKQLETELARIRKEN